jgi:hypothetical protein
MVLSTGIIADKTANFTAQITVPEAAYGNYFLRFQPDNGDPYTTFQFSVRPQISVSARSAKIGDTIMVSGIGFPSNDFVYLKINGTFIERNIPTDKNGSFLYNLHITSINPGECTLYIASENIPLYLSIILDILAPPVIIPQNSPDDSNSTSNSKYYPPLLHDPISPIAPIPVSPVGNKIGLIGAQSVTFQWTSLTNSTSEKYILEVDNNPDFSPAGSLIREINLSGNSHTLILEPGNYYWRIKAVTNGYESTWYTVRHPFQVGEFSVLILEFSNFIKNNTIFIIIAYILGAFIIYQIVISLVRTIMSKIKKQNY